MIAILTPSFPPERSPGAKRMSALAAALVADGQRVQVITVAPHYPGNVIHEGYGLRFVDRRDEDGVEVIRVRPKLAPRTDLGRRAWSEIVNATAQMIVSALDAPTVVVATSPSMVLGPVGAVVAGWCGARFVWDVRDLYWRYATELGKVKSAWFAWGAEATVAWTARQADLVTTTTPEQATYMRSLAPAAREIAVAPNGVDDDFFDWFASRPPRHWAPGERLRLVYGGLLGYAQGLGVLVDAACRLDPEQWEVVIAGDGPERGALEERARNLAHVSFAGYLDDQRLRELYASADVLYAQLRDAPAMRTAQPTKLLDYLATGRPIVYGGDGPGRRVLQEAGGGIVIAPDDPGALIAGLDAMRSDASRTQWGSRGRAYVGRHLLRSVTTRCLATAALGRS